jgi:hypothetical protein
MSGRSLAGYWMMLIAVIIVAVATSDDEAIRGGANLRFGARRRGPHLPPVAGVAVLFLPAAACLAVALGTAPPLTMHVVSARSSSDRAVWQLQVAVRNDTSHVLRPHFTTNSSGQATAFWNIRTGPLALAPHASAAYVLNAPDDGSVQPNGTPFLVEAVTDSPRTISSTTPFAQPGPVPGTW